MASYPIVIEAESINLGSMMTSMRDFGHQERSHDLDAVYANPVSTQSQEWMNTSISQNNLTALKAYLETPDNILKPYLSSVSYSYDASFTLMAYDPEGELIQTGSAGGVSGSMSSMPGMAGFSTIAALSPSEEDGLPGDAIKAQYELLAGDWPARPEDVVLVIDDDNEISDYTLYELGLLPQRDLRAAEDGSKDQILAQSTLQYQDLIGHSFYAVPDSFFYIPNAKGYYVNARDDQAALKQVIQLGIPLKVSGILRAGASATALKEGGMGYTQALLDLVIEKTEQSAAVTAQMASPHVNVLNGLAFAPETDSDKADQVRQYVPGPHAQPEGRPVRTPHASLSRRGYRGNPR